MSLQRNDQPEPQTSTQQPMSLDDLWEQMLAMRQNSVQEAEDKCQVALLLATVNKLCGEQTNFMTEVESKLDKINHNQIRTLNLQEQYKKEIGADASRLLNTFYHAIQEKQNTAFEEFSEKNNAAIEKMTTEAKTCAERIHNAAYHAENATKKLFRITKIADLIYYIAPAAVLADLLFRVIQFLT